MTPAFKVDFDSLPWLEVNVDLRDVIRISIEILSPILAQRLAPVVTDIAQDPLTPVDTFCADL